MRLKLLILEALVSSTTILAVMSNPDHTVRQRLFWVADMTIKLISGVLAASWLNFSQVMCYFKMTLFKDFFPVSLELLDQFQSI